MLNKTKGNAAPSPSFVGSIRDVQVNGEAITLTGIQSCLTIIPRARVGYEIIDSQRGA